MTSAWLTPEEIPDTRASVCLEFPDSEEWRSIIEGALLNLADETNWEPYGAVSVEQAAAVGFDIYQGAASSMSGCVPVGGIIYWTSYEIPDGWLVANGMIYDPWTYPRLYEVIGTRFGEVEGMPLLPALTGRFPRGVWLVELGDTGGEEEHTLTPEEMPRHQHLYSRSSGTVPVAAPGEMPVRLPNFFVTDTQPAGNDMPHNNLPPYINLIPIIRAK